MTRNSDTDEREESDTQLVTSRRAVLGALASAGVLGATASGAQTGANSNLSIGGGSMADKVDEFAIRTYQGPLSERPSAGVKDRVWVVEGGAEDGAVYHDDGSSWSKVSRQFESVHTDEGSIEKAVTGSHSTDHGTRFPREVSQAVHSAPPEFKPHPAAENPVITPADHEAAVSYSVDFIADPFVAHEEETGTYHMFYEVVESTNNDGYVGHATSTDGIEWTPQGDVYGPRNGSNGYLNYTFVHRLDGQWYMLDYLDAQTGIDILTTDSFPNGWSAIERITIDELTEFHDPTPFYHDSATMTWGGDTDKWYMAVHTPDNGPMEKHIYMADSFIGGDWQPHPSNPVAVEPHASTSGRPITQRSHVDMFNRGNIDMPNGQPTSVNTLRITELTPTSFSAEPTAAEPCAMPLRTSNGWPNGAVHHVDPIISTMGGPDVAIVDGMIEDGNNSWRIGVFTSGRRPTVWTGEVGSNTTVASSTETKLHDYSIIDGRSHYDTANDVYIIPNSGVYEVDATATWSGGTSAAEIRTTIKCNGSMVRETRGQTSPNNWMSLSARCTRYFSKGDELEAVTQHKDADESLTLIAPDYSHTRIKRTDE